jgi:hypothetical protein
MPKYLYDKLKMLATAKNHFVREALRGHFGMPCAPRPCAPFFSGSETMLSVARLAALAGATAKNAGYMGHGTLLGCLPVSLLQISRHGCIF